MLTGFTTGTTIPDANDGTATAEPAVFGVNAFASVSAAVAASSAGGLVIVNDGNYGSEAVNLSNSVTLQLVKKNLGATDFRYSGLKLLRAANWRHARFLFQARFNSIKRV